MQNLVIASHNAGKLKEISALLAPLGVDVTSAGALGLPEPDETGHTFAENASLKAHASSKASGKCALSDDSGLVIPALDGAPGIYSARWAGADKNFDTAFERIAEELLAKGINIETQAMRAYFICVLCLAWPDGREECFEGRVDGHLTFPPRGTKGFGYDPIFIPDGYTKTFAEIEPEAKHAISHRARAFKKLQEYLSGAGTI